MATRKQMLEILKAAEGGGWKKAEEGKLEHDEARELLLWEADYSAEGYPLLTEVERTDVDSTRWHNIVSVVVKDDEEKFWSFTYLQAKTEVQEDEWYGAADSLQQVEKREKTVVVTEWVPVTNG